MRDKGKKSIYIIVFIWLILISGSAIWNVSQIIQSYKQENLETARSLFDIIVTTREWNALLGGVYVPVTNEIQPNLYLDVEDREVVTQGGVTLTKINPAYMTRMLSEISNQKGNVNIHITSKKPIRPTNGAEPWEKEALILFEETNQDEYYEWNSSKKMFYYIAPLVTQESCLSCHEKQGYEVGDIRGGISVSFPTKDARIWPTIISHLAIGSIGTILIIVFGMKLVDTFSEIEKQTEVDGLTQVYNRYFLDRYFHREFLRAKRTKSSLAIIMCDIDFFKGYNDLYGHQKGDACLKSIAQALKSVLKRPGDIVTRYGGEEFAIILPDTSLEGVRTIAELLRAKIESLEILHEASKVSKYVTMSFGGCTYEGEETSLEALLDKVDKSMYQAKKAGRNIVVVNE